MDKLLTAKEVAEALRVEQLTLIRWRRQGVGPAYTKIGSRFRYKEEDIESFILAGSSSIGKDNVRECTASRAAK